MIVVCFIILACSVTSVHCDTTLRWRKNAEHRSDSWRKYDTDQFHIEFKDQGAFTISFGKDVWFSSGPMFVRKDGTSYKSGDNLKFVTSKTAFGQDELGRYVMNLYRFSYDQNLVDFSARQYTAPQKPAIIFSQYFHNDSSHVAASSVNDIVSGFPTFDLGGSCMNLGFLSFGGDMLGDTDKKFGRWGKGSAKINTGIVGGPVVIFNNKSQPITVFISPFSEFMAGSVAHDPVEDTVGWGIMGGVDHIPAGTSYETMFYYGMDGINKTIGQWGKLMRDYYRKNEDYRRADLTVNYLGYWTDQGAYYYYLTEPNKTYEQTVLDIKKEADSQKIPYRYFQYDSWFYPKGPKGGVKTWEPTAEAFPNGFMYVYNQTGWPAAAHNRWWSSTTTYAVQNGGQYQFILDPPKAIPTEEVFWEFLFKDAKKWGLILYEQDWLYIEFNQTATLTNLTLGRTWMNQMGRAAANNGLTIQYCMANPRHALQSLENPAVTQARVSDDYAPGNEQWRIGISSIFADALGLAPYKDTFWTTQTETGNKYGKDEPYPALEAVVATLSTGPVGPSDKIASTNVTLLMRCCNQDGLILKPSRPAVAIDKQILRTVFDPTQNSTGEIWSTYTIVSGYPFGIVFVADQENGVSLSRSDIGFTFQPMVAFSTMIDRNENIEVLNFTETTPLVLSKCSKSEFCLYYTSPVFSVGTSSVLIYGEEDKWVPMSPQRVLRIATTNDDITLTVKGSFEETVKFAFIEWSSGSSLRSVTCTFGPSGQAVIRYSSSQCEMQ
ncbi:hypothetical protein ScPMuIL_005621 [Solemya velum]